MNRRSFVIAAGAAWANASVPQGWAASHAAPGKVDLSLRIEPCTLDIGRGVQITTVAYNGQVPGPLLRFKKNKPVTIDVTNATSHPDLIHWHGLTTDSLNDGAVEEGSPIIAPGATLRYQLIPNPSGTRRRSASGTDARTPGNALR